MGTQGTQGKKDDDLVAKYRLAVLNLIDAQIQKMEALLNKLQAIKESPDFLASFSGQEIMYINQVERTLPERARDIRKFKEWAAAQDFSQPLGAHYSEQTKLIEMRLIKLDLFIDSVRERLPKVSHVSFFLMHPVYFLTHKLIMLKHRLQTKWINWKTQRTIARREKNN